MDFYILAAESAAARLAFTCRLIDKARRLDKRVFVATGDTRQTAALDQLLWSFRPESFIGHSAVDRDAADADVRALAPSPVLISHRPAGDDHHDLLINLGDAVPGYFSRFERLAEVVIQVPEILQATRNNYTFYRDRGYPIQSHHLGGNTSG
ncbi:DNA polymerase III subunit chi [Exilibacterium tricleocarpae]|uniref:DNA polymerase III subunit chi n=1 Tax=Exilibacterium tricleocarpae TaxID=2591008 RepID=UPI001FE5C2F3|nr:DNA polymerase III subunit chi [Exilibacterium tricleocarpae]